MAGKVTTLAGTVIASSGQAAHRGTMKISQMHVVVVGAATAGAAAALLFARAGARVTLLERVAQPRAVGAGIGLAENGLAVLESVGLGPAVSRIGCPVGTPRIVDGGGRPLIRFAGPIPRVLMVRRSDLQELLLDAVAAEPRIAVHVGTDVIGSDCQGAVQIRDERGETSIGGDLVIGADGVHSRLRACGDHGARLASSGITYVRALVETDVARGEEAWTGGGVFGSFAVPGGTYIFASAGGRVLREALAARDLDAFRAGWASAYPASTDVLASLDSFDQLLVNEVQRVTCERWFDREQVLVGDAVHAMAPNLGQGANSALVDVAILLDELRRADDLHGGLVRYQRRRQPAVAKVARAAAQLGSLAEITNPVGRWLRDRVMLPIATRVAGPPNPATVFQEPAETLLAIGRV
jgi:2-polyprenyl-6-methoxyphenol hydroxylase-like FAD-dependent oxidoreductase